MFEQLGLLKIGTLSFFAFSFLAGIFIVLQAILGSKKETTRHRVIKTIVGAAYAIITVLALNQVLTFMQLEGVKSPYESPYVDTGQSVGEIRES